MFINHTNHSVSKWSQKQRACAEIYGEIIDVPFPAIGASWKEEQITELVEQNQKKIMDLHPDVVLCQGEFVYSYRLINELKKEGIRVIAACSERVVQEVICHDGTTKKESIFSFVQFRDY